MLPRAHLSPTLPALGGVSRACCFPRSVRPSFSLILGGFHEVCPKNFWILVRTYLLPVRKFMLHSVLRFNTMSILEGTYFIQALLGEETRCLPSFLPDCWELFVAPLVFAKSRTQEGREEERARLAVRVILLIFAPRRICTFNKI